MSNNWSRQVSKEEAARRAGGRRRYNKQRQEAAEKRRKEVSRRFHAGQSQAFIAKALGVHRSTIHRDLAALRAKTKRCPHCGSEYSVWERQTWAWFTGDLGLLLNGGVLDDGQGCPHISLDEYEKRHADFMRKLDDLGI